MDDELAAQSAETETDRGTREAHGHRLAEDQPSDPKPTPSNRSQHSEFPPALDDGYRHRVGHTAAEQQREDGDDDRRLADDAAVGVHACHFARVAERDALPRRLR